MTPSASARRARPLVTLVTLLALLIAALPALAGCGSSPSKSSNSPSASASVTSDSASAAKPSGMTAVALASLPAEARDVVRRIEDGGTFQYRQDGVTFENREGRLPAEPRGYYREYTVATPGAGGYYREYTVATPGAADRGARRLILGRDGELYYTPDHYRTFQWVLRGGAS